MNPTIEADERGVIELRPEDIGPITPLARYEIERDNGSIVLRPILRDEPFWKTATPEEWAKSFREWAASHKEGPGLPDEALSRESIYDHI